MRGMFITFEGIDGSGKTRTAKKTAETLGKRGLPIVLTTEPTRTWLGDAVKRSYGEKVSVFTEAMLFMADRATHTEWIREQVRKGRMVISDRYCDSTYAYQGARLKGLVSNPMHWLRRMSAPFVIEPDLTILLDVEPRIGLRRIAPRKKKVHFEKERFLKQVRGNYLRLARGKRFVVVDASRGFDEVLEESLEAVSSLVSRAPGRR